MRPRFPLTLAVLALTAVGAFGQAPALPPPTPGVVGKSLSPAGTVARTTAGGQYDALPAFAELRAEARYVVLPDAALTNAKGTVKLTSRADLQGLSPLPIFETAVTLHDPAPNPFDLDVTLDCGRIDLTNNGPGPARVQVRFHRQRWSFTLDKPQSRVAVELVGRWPAGSAYQATPEEGHEPVVTAVAIVLAGTADLFNGSTTVALTAPPGPAQVSWASANADAPLTPVKLDQLPAWADAARLTPEQQARGREIAKSLETFRALRVDKPADAVDRMLASTNLDDRRIGLMEAAAHDDLARLGQVLSTARDRDLWDAGVSVLRHWLGRGAGQDKKLYDYLTATRQYTGNQAAAAVRLLHGFTPAEAKRPETYEVLIEYLRHEQPGLRNLAAWHLVRLVPQGKAFPFQPNAGPAEFEALHAKWKALMPGGKLPGK